jgi:hypothetical protein
MSAAVSSWNARGSPERLPPTPASQLARAQQPERRQHVTAARSERRGHHASRRAPTERSGDHSVEESGVVARRPRVMAAILFSARRRPVRSPRWTVRRAAAARGANPSAAKPGGSRCRRCAGRRRGRGPASPPRRGRGQPRSSARATGAALAEVELGIRLTTIVGVVGTQRRPGRGRLDPAEPARRVQGSSTDTVTHRSGGPGEQCRPYEPRLSVVLRSSPLKRAHIE